MFMYAMSCNVDNFDSLELIIFGLLQIWECTLNWFIVEPVHKHLLDICHLLLEILVGHVLVGVNPCGRCAFVVPLPQIAKLLKKS